MKTPVSTSWIPGLILIMASMPVCVAQTAPDSPSQPSVWFKRASSPDSVATPQAVTSLSAITTAKDSPCLPPPERVEVVAGRQSPKLRLSPWTGEVVKLAESGLETSVIRAFIENSGTFNLGADQIVYLNDLGLSGEIINAMLQHDRDLISGAKPLTITSDPEWDFSLDTLAKKKTTLSKPAIEPTPSRPSTTLEPVIATAVEAGPQKQPLQTQNSLVRTAGASLEQFAAAPQAAFDWQELPAARKKNSYPIREPYPVEITAPIVFISGDGRAPNTLVVLGFPRGAP